jgi:hypothetical protein
MPTMLTGFNGDVASEGAAGLGVVWAAMGIGMVWVDIVRRVRVLGARAGEVALARKQWA